MNISIFPEKYRRPDLIKKIKILFIDVETEGKKQGYIKASIEYKQTFKELESTYKETIELIKKQKNSITQNIDILIKKLSELEEQEEQLKKLYKKKLKDVSIKFNVSTNLVERHLSGQISMTKLLLDSIYNYKLKKFNQAKQLGYIEAKKEYEQKVQNLKKDLQKQKEKGTSELNELINLFYQVLSAIIKEYMKISTLNILLKEGK